LEAIARKHEECESHASKNFLILDLLDDLRTQNGHQNNGDTETHSKKHKRRSVIQNVFDHNEGDAPDQRTEHQRQVGLQTLAHARAPSGSTQVYPQT